MHASPRPTASDPPNVAVIIPALDEEAAIGRVIAAIPRPPVNEIVVVDNGSRDATARVAEQAGARVVVEPVRGYGRACLAGIAALREYAPEIIVFLDGDFSDYPEEVTDLIRPIVTNRADFVIGTRMAGAESRAALLPQARFGNALACTLLWMLYGRRFTDLGPFRAIRADALDALDMCDQDFGWTVEMQIKAVRQGLRTWEVPVRYRPRIGESKISGTLEGSVRAGIKILSTIARYA